MTNHALQTVVAGLRWDPIDEPKAHAPADLDLSCVLLDHSGKVVERFHPHDPRSKEAAVIHTGDSSTGAGDWDDERVFVFLYALQPSICAVAFVVSAPNRTFGDINNAWCQITSHNDEQELLRVHITPLGDQSVHCVATLRRTPAGWEIAPGAPDDRDLNELLRGCQG